MEVDLTDATADDVDQFWDDILSGEHPDVKDDGLSPNTVTGQQSTVRVFFEYHDQLAVEPDELSVIAPEKNNVDERDVYTGDEIDAMRDSIDHPRDRCLFDLLVYTGQRLRAVQTLRIKDVDLDDGTFYLNKDAGGLKGADGKRPLLGAEAGVREWLDYHPNPESDAYLITQRPDYRADADGSEPLTQKSIRRILDRIADDAGVDKPSNPHNFRHSFVTIAKRQYGMDDSTIKGLIGHRLESRVMEEVYSHLKDDDHVRAAQEATGIREPDNESPLSPDFCPTCDEPLPDAAKACPRCGIMFTPDAREVSDNMEDMFYEGQREADDEEESEAVDALKQALDDNPDLAAEVLEQLADTE
ncbi:site-specific integrase [Halomicroarcula sp. S1AR25-4]|uniref:site-specific integrase n=1 Tax=Haloarcula sp. S1AR25-4 TaxID=2950538 RepID=UPI0028740949|nr:site-specific integrase [Halomicroarcula sp. S1AR25-4]MDS0279391.1 site-specific integrase [Halomicroarcula sp. S1AR25-4]